MEEPMECETVLTGFPKHSAVLEAAAEPTFFHSPIPCDPCVSNGSAYNYSGAQWTQKAALSTFGGVRKRPAADMMFPHPVPPLVGRSVQQPRGWMQSSDFYSQPVSGNQRQREFSAVERSSEQMAGFHHRQHSSPPDAQREQPSSIHQSPPAATKSPVTANEYSSYAVSATTSLAGSSSTSPYHFEVIEFKPQLPSILISQPVDVNFHSEDFKPFPQTAAVSGAQDQRNSSTSQSATFSNLPNSLSNSAISTNFMLSGQTSTAGATGMVFNSLSGLSEPFAANVTVPAASNPLPNPSGSLSSSSDFSAAFSNSFPPPNLIPNGGGISAMGFGIPTTMGNGSLSSNIPPDGFRLQNHASGASGFHFPANLSASECPSSDSVLFRVPALPRRRPPQRSRSVTHLPLPTRVLIHDAAAELPTSAAAAAYRMFTWPIEDFQRRSAAGQPTIHSAQFFATADQRIPFTLSMDPNYGNGRVRFTGRFISVPTFEQKTLLADLAIWMQDERGNALREEKMRCVVVNEFISTVSVTLTADRRFLVDPQQNLLPNGTLMIWAQTHVRPAI